jgi:prepilin-type processing-associated H-X9-DG protein
MPGCASLPATEELLPAGFDFRLRFGSAHSNGCNFGFCDGSVRTISYDIDAEVHRRLGNRHDGLPIDSNQY